MLCDPNMGKQYKVLTCPWMEGCPWYYQGTHCQSHQAIVEMHFWVLMICLFSREILQSIYTPSFSLLPFPKYTLPHFLFLVDSAPPLSLLPSSLSDLGLCFSLWLPFFHPYYAEPPHTFCYLFLSFLILFFATYWLTSQGQEYNLQLTWYLSSAVLGTLKCWWLWLEIKSDIQTQLNSADYILC